MTGEAHRVTFEPDGKTVTALPGTSALEVASRAGIVLDAPCGGIGKCGKCRVRVTLGDPSGEGTPDTALPAPDERELELLTPDELEDGWRLACRLRVWQPMTMTIPETARLYERKVLMTGVERDVPLEPNICKTFTRLERPTVEDQRSDLDRLSDALNGGDRRLRPSLNLARTIPHALRDNDFEVTLVSEDGDLIAIEPGDTAGEHFGVAVDLGTTTVVGMLVDLNTGKQRAICARSNPQAASGDDVIARINRCLQSEAGARQLQGQAIGCINDIIDDLCGQAEITPDHVYEVCAAGNTTMTHLLLGVSPISLSAAPYVPAFRQSFNPKAAQMGLRANAHARLYTLPNIAGFVGGDTVGVILAASLNEAEELTLAVDIGTNGEIVLGTRERLVACSTAAGPAFEGARIKQGMRADVGAIDKVVIDDGLQVNVLGGGKARGLCGTGLIDAVAQLIQANVVDMGGRLNGPDALPNSTPKAVGRLIEEAEGGYRFQLAAPENSEDGRGVYLTQSDVRELQLAKAAIMAGVNLLAKELGARVDDIRHVLLAGAFGNYINPHSAKIIGLIPDLPEERLQFIGNAAGVGARMTLVSASYRQLATEISRTVDYVEMAARRDFQDEFMAQMMFEPCQTC